MAKNTKKYQILETEFQRYIEKIGLKDKPQNSLEIVERRRAFFVGATVMKEQLTEIMPQVENEEECIEFIENLSKEIDNFIAGIEMGER